MSCRFSAKMLLPLVAMLTYKSIDEALKAHDGKLLYLLPLPEGAVGGRKMFVQSGLLAILDDVQDTYDGIRHLMLREFLDAFSDEAHWKVSQHPHAKPGHVALSRVHPTEAEIWSFRCLDPTPGIRVLGRFTSRDCFVALNWDYRENFETDEDWDNAIKESLVEWQKLFGDLPPHQGSQVNDYLSSNCEDVPAAPWRKGSRRNY